jgi:hypothetical protein
MDGERQLISLYSLNGKEEDSLWIYSLYITMSGITGGYIHPSQIQSDVKRNRTKTDSKSTLGYQIRLKGHLSYQLIDDLVT